MGEARGSNKIYLAAQLLIVPLATLFAALFTNATLNHYQAIFPGYPELVTVGPRTPPEYVHLVHLLGPIGIVLISTLLTVVITVLSFLGNPRTSNAVNFVLFIGSIWFLLGVIVSNVAGYILICRV